MARYTGGIYYQRKIRIDFSRTYHSGTSVENINKELRYAMLSDCWEFHICLRVITWKIGYGQEYVAESFPEKTVDQIFTFSLRYLKKVALMPNVKVAVFGKEPDLAEALQEKYSSKHLLRSALACEYQPRVGPIEMGLGKPYPLPICLRVLISESVSW